MEYAGGGELYKYVDEKQRLNEYEARKILQQIVNAMSYCHNRGIVHRHLNLENVLFKSEGDMLIKLVDFGIAGVCAGTQECKDLIKGLLQKDHEKRIPLIDVMNLNYFMMDDEELDEKIKKAEEDFLNAKS